MSVKSSGVNLVDTVETAVQVAMVKSDSTDAIPIVILKR